MRGRFIALEGGDGAGKTTVLAALTRLIAARGGQVLETREPGGTPEGLALRALLLAEQGAPWDARAELLLMTAARVQHVRRVIAPALAAGCTVLCDRFVGSTLAYQGGGRGLDAAVIAGLHRDMVDDLWPDVTLLIDIDPEVGIARSRARLAAGHQDEGRFESLDLAFHRRVRAAYLALAGSRAGWHVIDASQAVEQVVAGAVTAAGL